MFKIDSIIKVALHKYFSECQDENQTIGIWYNEKLLGTTVQEVLKNPCQGIGTYISENEYFSLQTLLGGIMEIIEDDDEKEKYYIAPVLEYKGPSYTHDDFGKVLKEFNSNPRGSSKITILHPEDKPKGMRHGMSFKSPSDLKWKNVLGITSKGDIVLAPENQVIEIDSGLATGYEVLKMEELVEKLNKAEIVGRVVDCEV